MDVKAIRVAVADGAANVSSPAGYVRKLVAKHFVPDGAVDAPWCYPSETAGTYDETLDGAGGVVVTLRLLTSRSEDQAGQELLDAYLADTGASSVKAAIEAAMPSAAVTGFDGYRTYDVGGVLYFGAELTVAVLA